MFLSFRSVEHGSTSSSVFSVKWSELYISLGSLYQSRNMEFRIRCYWRLVAFILLFWSNHERTDTFWSLGCGVYLDSPFPSPWCRASGKLVHDVSCQRNAATFFNTVNSMLGGAVLLISGMGATYLHLTSRQNNLDSNDFTSKIIYAQVSNIMFPHNIFIKSGISWQISCLASLSPTTPSCDYKPRQVYQRPTKFSHGYLLVSSDEAINISSDTFFSCLTHFTKSWNIKASNTFRQIVVSLSIIGCMFRDPHHKWRRTFLCSIHCDFGHLGRSRGSHTGFGSCYQN